MIKLFRHHVSVGSALVLGADVLLLLAVVPIAIGLQERGTVFAVLMVALNGSLGLYRREGNAAFGGQLGRVLLAVAIGVPVAYVLFSVTPNGYEARSAIGYTVVLTLCGLILLRQVVFWAGAAGLGAKRVLIVGTGAEAAGVEQALASMGYPSLSIVGFYPAGDNGEVPAVAPDRIVPARLSLSEVVEGLGVRELIVAVREQRGGVLPLGDLVDCRVSGIPITDLAGVYERVRGEVPLESLKASWLIYGPGFAQGGVRSFVKRTFDLVVSIVLLVLALPVMALTALAIRFESPGPVIYRQERVGRGGRSEVPQHAPRRRARRRRPLGHRVRPAGDARRPLHPQEPHRRAAAAHQRDPGRHELRRAASRAADLRQRAEADDSVLRAAAQRQTGHHRLGAGPLQLRRLGRGCAAQEAAVRPVLRQESLPLPRPADPRRDRAGRALPRRRALTVRPRSPHGRCPNPCPAVGPYP